MIKKIGLTLTLACILTIPLTFNAYAAPLTGEGPLATPPQLEKKWDNIGLDINAGGTYLNGNANIILLNTALGFNANWMEHSLFLKENNMFNYVGDKTILNKVNASLLYTYGFLDHFNFYLSSTHSYNQFEKLNYRLSNGIGFCAHKYFSPEFKTFLVSLGGNYENEWYQQDTRNQARGALRLTFALPVTEYVELGSDSVYAPKIMDFSDYRLYEDAYMQFKITDNLFFKISLMDEYNSTPQPDVQNNDFGIISSFSMHFGN